MKIANLSTQDVYARTHKTTRRAAYYSIQLAITIAIDKSLSSLSHAFRFPNPLLFSLDCFFLPETHVSRARNAGARAHDTHTHAHIHPNGYSCYTSLVSRLVSSRLGLPCCFRRGGRPRGSRLSGYVISVYLYSDAAYKLI